MSLKYSIMAKVIQKERVDNEGIRYVFLLHLKPQAPLECCLPMAFRIAKGQIVDATAVGK
jgi:hypothetical protein